MGNATHLQQLHLPSLPTPTLPQDLHDRYLIRQFIAHSPQQHQELAARISHFQQHNSPHLIRVLDSHVVQTQQLCSIITHLYAVMEKPKHTLSTFMQQLQHRGIDINSRTLQQLLQGCIAGLSYLRKQDLLLNTLKQSQIYVEEGNRGELTAKIMNPFFIEEEYNEPQEEEGGAISDLGRIFQKYLCTHNHSSDLVSLIHSMTQNEITLTELEEKLGVPDVRRTKAKLKLAKNVRPKTIESSQRESFASSGSSLMIEADPPSDYIMLQDLLQNDSSLSQLSLNSLHHLMNSAATAQPDTSHHFPKKYLRSHGFRKSNRDSCWSDFKDDKQNITRDQSLKENVRIQPRMLESARLVESVIRQLQ